MTDIQMRGKGTIIGLMVVVLSAVFVNAMELSLTEAIERSLEAHPDAESARARLEALKSEKDLALVFRYPQLSARLDYQQTTNPLAGFGHILSQGTFDETIDFNDPGRMDALTGALDARYRIYSGGRLESQHMISDHMVDAGNHQLQETLAGLQDAVAGAYFSIRETEDIVRSMEAGISVLEENLRISRIKEEAGELIRTERLNLEVELATLNRELLAMQHQAKLARVRMAYLLGLPANTEINLIPDDPSVNRLIKPEVLSIENRAELKAARSQAKAASEGIDMARTGRMPTIDAYASWQADKGWRRDGEGTSWTTGIVMNVPVFDGFKTRSQESLAIARERSAMENVRRIELALQVELEQAKLAHELAVAQREVAISQVKQAEEAATLSRNRFSAGTLLSTELIGVESRLVNARVQLAIANSRERLAVARLRRVAGFQILD